MHTTLAFVCLTHMKDATRETFFGMTHVATHKKYLSIVEMDVITILVEAIIITIIALITHIKGVLVTTYIGMTHVETSKI